MTWRHLTGYIFLISFFGCHTPLLLSTLNPETQPKEKYKYYQPDFQLDSNALLRTDGYYYNVWKPREVTLTVEKYNQAKKHGLSFSGIDISKMNIIQDTTLIVVHTHVYVFYPNGTYIHKIYSNKSLPEISAEVETAFKTKIEGADVYKITDEKIYYESYSQMSGFFYNQGIVSFNAITVGKSQPYSFSPYTGAN